MRTRRTRQTLSGLLTVIVAAASLVACSQPNEAKRPDRRADCTTLRPLPVGDSTHSVTFHGQKRQYLLHVPPDYDGTKRTPVVYAFHGLGSSADLLVAYTGWAATADDENFIVVAPQGLGPVPHWDFVTPANQPTSDLNFVKQLTMRINKLACVDEDRTYATGFSNGSALTFAFACSGDFDFAAYGSASAAFYRPQCADAPPASIIYFHGTADPVVPFSGGPTPIKRVDPVPQTMASWAVHDDCANNAEVTKVSDKVDEYEWGQCAPGVDLKAYVIKGGGHTWPGAEQLVVLRRLGFTTDDVNATELIWKFFKEHPKRGQ